MTFYSLSGKDVGKPVIFLDTLKTSGLETKSDSATANGGKGNRQLVEWNHSKAATMQLQDALMSMKTLAMLNGTDIVSDVVSVYKTEQLVLGEGGKVTISETPIGKVSVLDADGKELAATNTTTAVTVTGGAAGSTVRVFYQHKPKTTAEKIVVSASKFPGYYKIVGDTVIRNADTGEDEAFQIVIHKAKLKSDLKMEFKADGDPSVFDLDLNVFANDKGDMIEYIKY